MNTKLSRAAISLAIFVVVCLVGTMGLLAIFSQFRFSSEQLYRAEFTDVSGLKAGDFVRIAGVEVGKVTAISINADSHALVEFSADPTVELTDASKAAVRWENPIGDRYLALLEGTGGMKQLSRGETINVNLTEPALDLDTLLGGFRPLFRALDPEQVNVLSSQLISVFQGEGATIGSFLNQAAAITSTLADRDELIGQVIVNLNAVVGSFSGESTQFAKAVDSLAQLTKGLADRKTDVANAIAYTNAATGTIADLLVAARPPLKDVVTQTDRVATIVADDHVWFDQYLETIPQSYKVLSRLGIMGDFFTFYLCDLVLKVNGKGGQPVYIKLAGQSSGRCAPK
ncbi:mammalian cell entry protein [Mycolicibacterium novocastrense]|uniref:MCE family protein n=1 Tax=Mycolicibacterium novocastrense TaxID=59813 RepID=UPI00074AFB9D|nr:MCE family protein [Mycolicibacterium novocastrense]KUH67522.1 mammalian cell entry protein [Mycolicibacterium novocastrense]KUH71405.1 mammalian cell entry protein [Mycolicibacterium novocastrense]KUH73292.1 mammalian cell entry protein [Mycolicibacterium novocastrense]